MYLSFCTNPSCCKDLVSNLIQESSILDIFCFIKFRPFLDTSMFFNEWFWYLNIHVSLKQIQYQNCNIKYHKSNFIIILCYYYILIYVATCSKFDSYHLQEVYYKIEQLKFPCFASIYTYNTSKAITFLNWKKSSSFQVAKIIFVIIISYTTLYIIRFFFIILYSYQIIKLS